MTPQEGRRVADMSLDLISLPAYSRRRSDRRSRRLAQDQLRGLFYHAMLLGGENLGGRAANRFVIDLDARDSLLGHDVPHAGHQANVLRAIDPGGVERPPEDERHVVLETEQT